MQQQIADLLCQTASALRNTLLALLETNNQQLPSLLTNPAKAPAMTEQTQSRIPLAGRVRLARYHKIARTPPPVVR